MTRTQSPRRRHFALAVFACFAMAMLASAPAALATHSDQYDAVQNPVGCPTASPVLNNLAFEGVVCVGSVAAHASFKFGNLETEVNTPTTVGFALAPGSPAIEPEVCPDTFACFRSVPGSTVMHMDPIKIAFPLHGHGKPPHIPFPPFHPKPGGHWDPWHGHDNHWHFRRKNLSSFSLPSIRVTPEPAGDIHAFTIFFQPGGPAPVFKFPFKIHLEGPLFGDDCYIGSNSDPIEFPAIVSSEPNLGSLPDPNGLPVETLQVSGMDMASNTFSVPGATNCGPTLGFGKNKHHLLDHAINSILALPSPAGANAMLLGGSNTTFAFAESGAQLKAAFEAANAP